MNNKPSKEVRSGFDTSELRNQHIILKMYEDPQIKKFLALMGETYEGDISVNDIKDLKSREDLNVSYQIKKELYDVLIEHIQQQQKGPKKTTEKKPSKEYTDAFSQEHREQLYELGLYVDQKYDVKAIRTEEGEKVYNIQILMRIGDMGKYLGLLSHISIVTTQILYCLEIINNGTCDRLDKNLIGQERFPDNDKQVKKFFGQCELLDQEYNRLGLRDYFKYDDIKSYIIAYKTNCLKTYTTFLQLGFIGCLHKQNEHVPIFINDIIYQGQTNPNNTLYFIKKGFSCVEKAIRLLDKIKNNKILFNPLIEELGRGLHDAILIYEEKDLDKNVLRHLIAYEETVDSMIEDAFSRE